MDLRDERSLQLDQSECQNACFVLTNPRKRLSAEVAWLPGIAPKRVREILSELDATICDLDNLIDYKSIARANLLAAGLSRLTDDSWYNVSDWIHSLASTFEDIDPNELCSVINEERIASGFPEITDLSVIEEGLQERRVYYKNTIKAALDKLTPLEIIKIVNVVVESATEGGTEQAPILVDDLVNLYEVEAKAFLDQEEQNIEALINKVREAVDDKISDSALSVIINKLCTVVKNWDNVAQPIQLSTKSRGHDHEASLRVAMNIRSLAVDLFNEYGKLEFSRQLTTLIQDAFAEVDVIAERTAEDVNALNDIAAELNEYNENTEAWRNEITYEVNLGVIFKDKLRILPEGIEWRGRLWELGSISRVRWGGTKHSINGIPTGTVYTIVFGDNDGYSNIELTKQEIYTNIVDRLWKAVGVRLLKEFLESLQGGKKIRYGSAILNDSGIEIERKKMFSSNERVFCKWSEIEVWNGPGTFCIRKATDIKVATAFSYQDEDNIHILEAAIRLFLKKGGTRLSSLLEE